MYTVNKVAALSGVTIRTLRYYDEIGLLKPAIVDDNGYRKYGVAELLRLQQILLYREIGYELKQIKKILNAKEFDIVASLHEQEKKLHVQVKRIQKLLQTIKKTIEHVKGNKMIDIKDMYYGIRSKQQKEYEEEVIKRHGEKARVLIDEVNKSTAHWTQADLDKSRREYEELMAKLALAMQKGLAPESPEVQVFAHAQYEYLSGFYAVDKELFIGLGQTYVSDERFRAFFDQFRFGLAAFLAQAMKVYAEKNL
jgi:DNA-binding transcriptional MerR regulator